MGDVLLQGTVQGSDDGIGDLGEAAQVVSLQNFPIPVDVWKVRCASRRQL